MLKIEKPPTVKLHNRFDVYIARYPVSEEDKLKYYIYLTENEQVSKRNGENSLEEFKKRCEEKIVQFSQKKLINLLNKKKKHMIISPCLDNNGIVKIINDCFLEYVSEDDCYIV